MRGRDKRSEKYHCQRCGAPSIHPQCHVCDFLRFVVYPALAVSATAFTVALAWWWLA